MCIRDRYDGQSVTYGGQTRPLSEHVLNRVSVATLMDYRDHAWGGNGLVTLAGSEIAFAGSIGKRVRVGVETNAPGGQPAYITFYEEGRRVMLGELATTRNAYAGAAGFGGAAVNGYNGYAAPNPQRGAAPWVPVSWDPVPYTQHRSHETVLDLVSRLMLYKKNT